MEVYGDVFVYIGNIYGQFCQPSCTFWGTYPSCAYRGDIDDIYESDILRDLHILTSINNWTTCLRFK